VLDPCAGDAANGLENQQFVTSAPYYSTVRFLAVRSGAGPYLYTVTTGVRGLRAFGYAIGDQMQAAGYTAAEGAATYAETNIQTKNQTISGARIEIAGIALQWHSAALVNIDGTGLRFRLPDYALIAAVERSFSVEFGLNGDTQTIRLGTMGMVPGAGGIQGGAPFASGLPFLDGPQVEQYATNGWPTRGNFFRLPEGMVWMPNNTRDGNLNVVFHQQQPIILPSGGSAENNALGTDQAAIASVSAGYNYPTELALECKVFLIGQQVGPRSQQI
jgi:hypothetical protein